MIRLHIHDRHGHRMLDRVLDQGAQGSQGTTGTAYGGAPRKAQRPEKPAAVKAGGFTVDQPGSTHQAAAQQHEAAAQQIVGTNYGAQNPVSRAHTEAAKAHKTAHSLLGKPGYQQAAHWANSATEHARRLAQPPKPQQPSAQPAQDYGTAEGARNREQGVRRPGAPGYSGPPRPQRPNGQTANPSGLRSGQSGPTLGQPERQRMAGRLAHLQQASANPFAGRQHQGEIQQLRGRLANRDAVASPRAPGTPKPPAPPAPKAPPSPKPPASAAPPKPPQPKPPGATPPKPAAAKPGPGPIGAVAHAAHGVAGFIEGVNRFQQWGEGLQSKDAGTHIGGRRGHSTRRRHDAEDEQKERRSWFAGHRSIDAWFYRDFEEGKVKRGASAPGHSSGEFAAGNTAGSGGKSTETKSERPEGKKRATNIQAKPGTRPPGRGAQMEPSGHRTERPDVGGLQQGKRRNAPPPFDKATLKGDMSQPPKGGKPKQPIKDIDELYDKSREAEAGFIQDVSDLAEQYGGKALFTPEKFAEPGTTLKSRKSANEKMKEEDIAGDPSRILDIVRGTVETKDVTTARAAARDFVEHMGDKIVRVKDRIVNPTGGYRDILVNFRCDNGIIAELQFNSENMLYAKNYGEGHKLYEEARALKRDFPGQFLEKLAAIDAQSVEVYEAAYHKDGNGNWGR
jgi:hypothetical protein